MNAHINGRNVVVTVTGEDSEDVRKAARKVACGEAHTALIGKLLTVKETRDGHAYTWGPVTARKTGARSAHGAPKATHAPDGPAADVLAMLGHARTRARRPRDDRGHAPGRRAEGRRAEA
jgi:hypothetical protein